MSSLRRLLREPLLHFVVIGALLFAAYGLIPGRRASPVEIVVTRGKIEQLAAGFVKVWQRPPNDAELKGLIDDWVREEIAVREATALGLDRDDTVVRRRLRQKLEFLTDDAAARVAPTEDDLKAYLAAHPERFRVEPRFSFRQVYLNPQRYESKLQARTEAVREGLERVGSSDEYTSLGDPSLLEPGFENMTVIEVERQFGPTFAAALGRLVPGQWEGPVPSGYGLHFVQLQTSAEGRTPDLAEVGDAVRREWANERRLQSVKSFYDVLLDRYDVRFEADVTVLREARDETPAGDLRSGALVHLGRTGARDAPGVPGTEADRRIDLRRALEGPRPGGRPSPGGCTSSSPKARRTRASPVPTCRAERSRSDGQSTVTAG